MSNHIQYWGRRFGFSGIRGNTFNVKTFGSGNSNSGKADNKAATKQSIADKAAYQEFLITNGGRPRQIVVYL